ncbi:MAG: NIPSNAP family protein [Betaproteobacteria bacterium]|jgi:hypothetical protein
MILEERTYTIVPGLVQEYLELYEKEAKPIHWKYLGTPVGWFVSETGVINQVVHLWRYESMAEREERRAALYSDPAWNAYRSKAGARVQHQENRILRPVSFSPMK